MRSMLKFVGMAIACSGVLTTGAALAQPGDAQVAKAAAEISEQCPTECYLNLAGRDGSMRTVLVRNGAASGDSFAFEIIARGEGTEWEGLQVSSAPISLTHVVGWKSHAQVSPALTASHADYMNELSKVKAFVRRDQVAADAKQTELQRSLIKYLVALGYVGH